MQIKSTAPLTPAMVDAIKATGPEDVMAGGSTRTGLINRGLVHPKDSDRFGKLTEGGLMLRAKMLPAAEAAPEPATVSYPYCGGAEAHEVARCGATGPHLAHVLQAAPEPANAVEAVLDEGQRANLAAGTPVVVTDQDQAREVIAAYSRLCEEWYETEPATTPRRNGKAALADTVDQTAVIVDPKAEDQAEAWTEPAAGTLRTRFHGKTLQARRQARKNQKAARRRTRGKSR